VGRIVVTEFDGEVFGIFDVCRLSKGHVTEPLLLDFTLETLKSTDLRSRFVSGERKNYEKSYSATQRRIQDNRLDPEGALAV
jgi:hypothetical protein